MYGWGGQNWTLTHGQFWTLIDKNEQNEARSVPAKAGIQQKEMDSKQHNYDQKQTGDERKRIAFAKKLAEQSQPITGTLAEKYLKEHRAITLETYPDDVRFHPGIYSKLNGKTSPAMLVIARDRRGQIRAVQATYLDKLTARKIDKTIAPIQKQTFGIVKGATVNFTDTDKKGAPTLIVEGTETGLSLASAIKDVNIKITLSKSNFINLDSKSLSEKVVVCVDNDGKDIKQDKLIMESTKRLLENHKQVYFMVPMSLKNQKQDYNDILKQLGTEPIKHDFKHMVSSSELYGKFTHASIKKHMDLIQPELNSKLLGDIRREIGSSTSPEISAKETGSVKQEHTLSRVNQKRNYQPSELNFKQNEMPKTLPKSKEFEQEI